MDLKIKDVAELLNVSETTIRRWLTLGQIPAYRLNHQYRFSRLEIENWMMSCKLKKEESFSSFGKDSEKKFNEEESFELPLTKAGTQQFSLFRALHKGEVLTRVPGSSKEEIIRAGAKAASIKLGLDEDLIAEFLLDREKLMPTALNHGVAIPHPREFIVKGQNEMIIALFPENPIDFGALDGEPVHSLFFLFSSQDKRHLHLLAKIAHLAAYSEASDLLRSHPEKETLMSFIRSWEGTING